MYFCGVSGHEPKLLESNLRKANAENGYFNFSSTIVMYLSKFKLLIFLFWEDESLVTRLTLITQDEEKLERALKKQFELQATVKERDSIESVFQNFEREKGVYLIAL